MAFGLLVSVLGPFGYFGGAFGALGPLRRAFVGGLRAFVWRGLLKSLLGGLNSSTKAQREHTLKIPFGFSAELHRCLATMGAGRAQVSALLLVLRGYAKSLFAVRVGVCRH